MTQNRWSEYVFRNGQRASNRVVVPPMASQTADEHGFVTSETLEHYKRLGRSGAGIVFVEYSFIHKTGRGEPNQLAVSSDSQLKGLCGVAKIIRDSGALSGLQIVHVGGKTTSELIDEKPLGASSISVPVKGGTLEVPALMKASAVPEMINWYYKAAERGYEAGFDIIELHAAHGYGLNQWLSPITNQRADAYGGSQKKRAEILYQIVRQIKNKFPNKLLAIRLPAEDHYEGGLSFETMKEVLLDLESFGVDIFDVSSGIGGWRRPRGLKGEGYLVEDSMRIKKLVEAAVIGVGGIKSGSFIDQLVDKNDLDFAAVGRAILQDPVGWKTSQLTK